MRWAVYIKQTALISHTVKNNNVVRIKIRYHPVNSLQLTLSWLVTRHRSIKNST